MKKQIKKIITISMAVVLCMSTGVFAAESKPSMQFVHDNEVSPKYTAILDLSNYLSLESSDGKLYCQGDTHVYWGYKAGVTVELQQYDGSWNTIKTWYNAENSRFAVVSEYYYVVNGTYRLKVTHEAYNSNGTVAETEITYSDIVRF